MAPRSSFPPAESFFPARRTLPAYRAAAQDCRACPLYRDASQAVFGEGGRAAAMALVGEQPGNQEDLAGRPFVGPAGKLLDEALSAAGLDRAEIYVTNVVKHFRFERRGASRIHKTPGQLHVTACMPWLEEELALVEPAVLVCLGSVAARKLVGPQARVQRDRGRIFATRWAPITLITYHPSALLRAPDAGARAELRTAFDADLAAAARALRRHSDKSA